MNVLDQFSIPYKGLGDGMHNLHFQVDDSFFAAFENALIQNGSFEVEVLLDKRPDHSIMTFRIQGVTVTDCDRCLSEIELPVEGEYTLHFKFSEIESEDDEVVFLHPDTSIINLSRYIYDVIGLSVPVSKWCEDQEEMTECDPFILSKMSGDADQIDDQEDKNPLGIR